MYFSKKDSNQYFCHKYFSKNEHPLSEKFVSIKFHKLSKINTDVLFKSLISHFIRISCTIQFLFQKLVL